MADPQRMTPDEMTARAASGVAKVDLLGLRGATLVTCEEVIAMAALLAISGAIPAPVLETAYRKRSPE